MSKKENIDNNNNHEILEQGDIYFFYRPKKNSQEVKGMEDVRRFFMITAPEPKDKNNNDNNDKKQFYRLFVIGKKSLPEIRKGDGARPAGIGKYIIIRHQNHAELAYILESPDEPGEAQKEFGIEKEASYIISVINPNHPTPTGYPSAEESPKYPEKILKEFDKNGNFVSLSKDTDFINYQNAQVILIGAREGKDELSKEFGVDIEEQVSGKSMDIFKKLNIKRGQISTKPLTEGKLE